MALGAAHALLVAKSHWVETFGIPLSGWRRLLNCARDLPPAFSSYYLELHFAEPGRVDLLPLAERKRRGFSALQRFEYSGRSERARDAWACVRRIGGADLSDYIWLEFDLPDDRDAEEPVPSVGICVEPNYISRHDRTDVEKTALADVVAALRALHPHAVESVEQLVSRIHANIPEGGNVIHVMQMLGRKEPIVKLYVSMPNASVVPFLNRIGWPGRLQDFSWMLERTGANQTVFLDLSILEDIRPRIGVAISQFHLAEQAEPDPRWATIISDWVGCGLCTGEAAGNLRRWPGGEGGVVWGVPTWTTRWLDLKLVLDDRGEARAKAYLGLRADPLPPLAAVALGFPRHGHSEDGRTP